MTRTELHVSNQWSAPLKQEPALPQTVAESLRHTIVYNMIVCSSKISCTGFKGLSTNQETAPDRKKP